jgi:hypothetical protein
MGQIYVTTPGSALLFPSRRLVSTRVRQHRITHERRQRAELNQNSGNDCENPYFPSRPPPPTDDDPPPF